MQRMKGKTILITGAAKGIGRGIARVFASEGGQVVIADIDEAAGNATAAALSQLGGEGAFFRTDITRQADLEATVRKTVERFGSLDVLCSNAGIFPSARLDEMTEADWDQVHNINLKGMFFAVKSVLPQMRRQKKGRIVLTSSITGPITGYPGWAHYGASKAGMIGFMHTAAIELAKDAITINAVLPGNIMTEGLENIGQDYLNTMTASIPMGRLGTPEDIAYAMLFLASEEAGYITGQTIIVDGGQVLPESAQAMG